MYFLCRSEGVETFFRITQIGTLKGSFLSTRLKWDTLHKPSKLPSHPLQNKNKKTASDAARARWVPLGARSQPRAPAGVPEEAAVFLGPRQGWVGTTRGRAGLRRSSLSGA